MKKYTVYFYTQDGDLEHEWVTARNAEEAAQVIQQEHWNVDRIAEVTQTV